MQQRGRASRARQLAACRPQPPRCYSALHLPLGGLNFNFDIAMNPQYSVRATNGILTLGSLLTNCLYTKSGSLQACPKNLYWRVVLSKQRSLKLSVIECIYDNLCPNTQLQLEVLMWKLKNPTWHILTAGLAAPWHTWPLPSRHSLLLNQNFAVNSLTTDNCGIMTHLTLRY